MKREDVLWTLAGLGFIHSYLTGNLTGALLGTGTALYVLHHRASFRPRVKVSPEFPEEVEEGKEGSIKLHVKNAGGPVRVEFFGKVIDGVKLGRTEAFLREGENRTLEIKVLPKLKGRYDVELRRTVVDPSGLYMDEIALGKHPLKVYPSVDTIREASREEKNVRIAQAYRKNLQVGMETMELHGLREYYPGDDLRRIDWKASARLGELIVRELMRETESPVYIVLDATRGMRRRIKRSKIDYASTLVLYLATLLITKNHRVGLIVYSEGGTRLIPPSAGKEQINRIRLVLEFRPERGLPVVRTELGEVGERARKFLSKIFPRRKRGITEALLEIKEPSHIFLITDLMGETTKLYRAVTMLKKKHGILILSPNPILFTDVKLDEETLKTLYRRYTEREEIVRRFNAVVPTLDLGPSDYAREILAEVGEKI